MSRYTKYLITVLAVFIISIRDIQAQQVFNKLSSTGYVQAGDLDVTGNKITVEALIYSTVATTQALGYDIVSKHCVAGDVNYLLRPAFFQITTTNGYVQMNNPYTLQANTWYHVAGTYDGSFARYYVNGCLVAQVANTGNLINNNYPVTIGSMACSPTIERFSGMIDEVRIWNVARTQQEIADNMSNLPNPATQPGLLAYYKFEGDLINAQGNSAWNGVVGGGTVAYATPSISFAPFAVNASVCATGAATGTVTLSTNETGAVYSSDGTTFQASNIFTNQTAGTHTYYARSVTGCVRSIPVNVPQTQVNIDIPNPTVCIGTPLNITASGDITGLTTSQWNFGDGSPVVTGTTNTSHTYSTAGNRTVQFVYANADFCSGSTVTVSKTVSVVAAPVSLSANNAVQTFCTYSNAAISALSYSGDITSGYSWQWQSSTDNIIWTDISGATGNTYTPPSAMLQTAGTYYYRRMRTSASATCNAVADQMFTITVKRCYAPVNPHLMNNTKKN
jgi:hypothetical protein